MNQELRKDMLKNNKNIKNSGGYAILLIVVILSAASLIVITSLLIWGFYFNRTSLDLEKSKQAKGLADTCAEAALQEIRNNDAYLGTNNLSLGKGTCVYVVSGISPNKTIQATGTVNQKIRKVWVIVDQINPQINISSWQEVADF